MVPMIPWYQGFKGTIQCHGSKYKTTGVWTTQGSILTITELPIGKWTSEYKEFLDKLVDESKIDSFVNHSSETDVHFVVKGVRSECDIEQEFKLTTALHTTNMHCFDEHGIIQRYACPLEIIKGFARVRSTMYHKRKVYQLNVWNQKLDKLSTEIRFMKLVMDDDIRIFRQTKNRIHEQLLRHSFEKIHFDALLGLKLDAFTTENIESKRLQIEHLEKHIFEYTRKTISQLWTDDIENLKIS